MHFLQWTRPAKKQPRRTRLSLSRRFAFALFNLLLILVVVDQGICLSGWPHWPKHDLAPDGKEWMLHCYSSDPEGRFPLDIAGSREDQARVRRLIRDQATLQRLLTSTPHCTLINKVTRRRGLHPERPRKLLLLGDSFTMGYGLSHRHTLGALMEQADPRFNVLNLGIPGADAREVRAILERVRGIGGRVKDGGSGVERILYFYNLNDVEGLNPARSRGQDDNFLSEVVHEGGTVRGYPLVNLSGLYRAVMVAARRMRISDETVSSIRHAYLAPESSARVARTMAHIAAMARLARSRSVDFVLVIYPLLHQDLAGRYPFEEVHRLLLSRCRALGVKCVDGLPALRRHDMADLHVHPADSHPNERANKAMTAFLIEQGHWRRP